MPMSRFLNFVQAALLLCCPADGAQLRETDKAREEDSSVAPVLQRLEVVEVVPATWEEIADECRTAETIAAPASAGRLMTLRLGSQIYRIFLSDGQAIPCLETGTIVEQPGVEIDPLLQEIVAIAVSDLSERLSVAANDIRVARAERVVWRDSSAGCPESDRVYMQVLTEGARVVLEFEGAEYRYHQVRGAEPLLCDHPSPIEPLPGPEIQ